MTKNPELIENSLTEIPNAKHVSDTAVSPTSAIQPRVVGGTHESAFDKPLRILNLILSAFSRWWAIAIPAGVVLAVVAAASAWLIEKPTYTSVALLKISENNPYIAYPSREATGRFVRTQLQMFRTGTVLNAALEDLPADEAVLGEVAPDEWIREHFTAGEISKSEIIRTTYTDHSAQSAQRILAAIVDSYLAYHQNDENNEVDQVIGMLEKERARRENGLAKLRDRLRDNLTADVATVAQENRSDTDSSPINAIQELLIQTEVDLTVASAQLAVAKNNSNIPPVDISEFEVRQARDSSPRVLLLNQEIAMLENKISDIERTMKTPGGRTYTRAKRQLTDAKTRLEKTVREVEQQFRETVSAAATSSVARKIRKIEDEIKSKKAVREHLLARLDTESGRLENASEETLDLEFMKGDIAQEEAVYNRIASRIVELQTEKAAPVRVKIVDPPNLPAIAESNRWLYAPGAGLAALLLPFIVLTGWEAVANRIYNEEVLSESDLPVIGEIARIRAYRPRSDSSGHKYTLFEESIDNLSGQIRLTPELSGKQVLAVMSALPNEGKTHVSSQLAVSLAKSCSGRVLLLEADLRSPDIANMFGVANAPGLADVLGRSAKLHEVVQKDIRPGLDVIVAGQFTSSLSELIQTNDIEALFGHLKKHYDYIVIDTSPILSTGESLFFSKLSDAVFLCVMKGLSRLSQVKKAQQQLRSVNANVSGVILSGISQMQYRYSYGRYQVVSR